MITILGTGGFIGSNLVQKLKALDIDYFAPGRNETISNVSLDKIIYCIGVTYDFKERPLDTLEANLCELVNVIKNYNFDSITYLSSVRLFNVIQPSNTDIYNLSKIMAENVLLNYCKKDFKIVRLSNVYGFNPSSTDFLTSIIKDSISNHKITLKTTMDSGKDYISINDVTDVLIKIALKGTNRFYNIAYGQNTANLELINKIKERLSFKIEVTGDAERIIYPEVDISRIKKEFAFKPSNVLADLTELIDQYEEYHEKNNNRF